MARETPPYMTTAKRTSRWTSISAPIVSVGDAVCSGLLTERAFVFQPFSQKWPVRSNKMPLSARLVRPLQQSLLQCSTDAIALYDADSFEAARSLMLISDVSVR